MKIYYLTTALLLFSSLLLCKAPPALAHFLSTDGSIGAILHVDPDDSPIANQTATFFFDIKDKEGKFRLSGCDCKVVVKEGGQELISQPVAQADLSTPSFSFIFPKKDAYRVQLVGTPIQPNGFQPFTIGWDVRVDRDSGGSSGTPNAFVSFLAGHVIHIVLILGALSAIAYQLLRDKKKGKAS